MTVVVYLHVYVFSPHHAILFYNVTLRNFVTFLQMRSALMCMHVLAMLAETMLRVKLDTVYPEVLAIIKFSRICVSSGCNEILPQINFGSCTAKREYSK